MLILRVSDTSPFVRKVKIALALLGLQDKVEYQLANHRDPKDSIRQQNPLGKIPTLLLDSGEAIFDSRVILEYLDYLAGGARLMPHDPLARITMWRDYALAEGITEAAVAIFLEKMHHNEQQISAAFINLQQGKIKRALAYAEQHLIISNPNLPNAAQLALICALGFLDLRFAGEWRQEHPKLVAWLDSMKQRFAIIEETRYKDES